MRLFLKPNTYHGNAFIATIKDETFKCMFNDVSVKFMHFMKISVCNYMTVCTCTNSTLNV